jgi:hypothetical protein
MTQFERSAQFWAVLVQAARSHCVLSYEQVERMTGIPRFGQSSILANILNYCQQRELPPLTCIVVEQATGMPASDDFAGLDISAQIRRVFIFDWLSHGAPSVADFEAATAAATV